MCPFLEPKVELGLWNHVDSVEGCIPKRKLEREGIYVGHAKQQMPPSWKNPESQVL